MNNKLFGRRRVSGNGECFAAEEEAIRERVSQKPETESELPQWNFEDLKENGVGWWTRFLLRIAPMYGAMRLARLLGFDPDLGERLHFLFAPTRRVHVEPLCSGLRGFQLIINNMTALYFYQNGDHFEYDGFEVGHYEDGKVTVFDGPKV